MTPKPPQIDSHHHLWRYTAEEYGWISDDMAALRRDFRLEDLRTAMVTAGVDGTVAVQARQTVEETRWLLELAEEKGSPIFGVVGWLPIASASFASVAETFATRSKLCGLRHVVQGEPEGFLDRDDFNHGLATLREHGWTYDLLVYARQLPAAIRFVDRHPDQIFVLDHIGKPNMLDGGFSQWQRDFAELARRDNVFCKLSGMITETDWRRWSDAELEPYFGATLEAFGPDRLMAGTDWPVVTLGASYEEWWHALQQFSSKLSADEAAAILGGNAVRVYRLETHRP